MLQWLRRLFGSGAPADDGALHLYVRCMRCSSPVHVRIDPRNDLTIEYDDDENPSGYRLIKEIMDSRCFQLMRAELTFDSGRREMSRTLEGGSFIARDEYEQLLANSQHERRPC